MLYNLSHFEAWGRPPSERVARAGDRTARRAPVDLPEWLVPSPSTREYQRQARASPRSGTLAHRRRYSSAVSVALRGLRPRGLSTSASAPP